MNRSLILAAHSDKPMKVEYEADLPEDVRLLAHALQSSESRINLGHAGTASRFLTAHLAITTSKPVILDGSPRLRERPMAPLIDALRELGAEIHCLRKEGFLPIEIRPMDHVGGRVRIRGDVSSQFISALLLAAPSMKPGLDLEVDGELVSQPYIRMTLSVLEQAGVSFTELDGMFGIGAQPIKRQQGVMELDWSAAIFCYSWVALGMLDEVLLPGLNMDSVQGDKVCAEIFQGLGVETHVEAGAIRLEKKQQESSSLDLDLNDYPDLAQGLIFTCAALRIPCHLKGLSTLPEKETDRLSAMKEVLGQVGIKASIGDAHISIPSNDGLELRSNLPFRSYGDHRMAMSIALLCQSLDGMAMDHPDVVEKSFPTYWKEATKAGIHIRPTN